MQAIDCSNLADSLDTRGVLGFRFFNSEYFGGFEGFKLRLFKGHLNAVQGFRAIGLWVCVWGL